MSYSLGLDTGGTYTDAVVLDDASSQVVAKAKSLTTRFDLSIGIAKAAEAATRNANLDSSAISMVSISTTLATNALVEGQGGRVALIMIGFDKADLSRSGLAEALGSDPVIFVPGGHDVHGKANTLEIAELEEQLETLAQDVSAFAVAGLFAVRNPAHEIAVRDLILKRTDRRVTCSHELSSKLDGPMRALTTLLNARLIDLIGRLILATRGFLQFQKIDAPLMVVRGDGSLVSADFALIRPIETILSGPAASLVGAHFLTGADNAIISDIGGTTTDIAVLDEGQPRIDARGASVGGFRTMVDAVAMHTFGLGGDSEVKIDEGALKPAIQLGPRRLVPVSLMAQMDRDTIVSSLERQLKAYSPSRTDGQFAIRAGVPDHLAAGLTKSEISLLDRLTEKPQALDKLLNGTAEIATLNALTKRGLAMIGGLTPSDAQHALGAFSHWDTEAARLATDLFARKRDGNGKPIATTGKELAQRIVARLERLSAEKILETVFHEDGLDGGVLVHSPLVKRALDREGSLVRTALLLDRPLIGLGAAASAYYPNAAEILGVQDLVPDHADVANAIGAVAGQVRVVVTAEIVQDEKMRFQITGTELPDGENHSGDEDEALDQARALCETAVRAKAEAAGAVNIDIAISQDISASMHDDQRQFISATIIATAAGRPAASSR